MIPRTNRAQVAEIAAQIGSTLMPDNAVWTNRFQIISRTSGHRYTIAQRKTDGVWGCECPGWIHYRKCKHLKQVLRLLAAVAAKVVARATAATYDASVIAMLQSARTAWLDLDVTPVKSVQTQPHRRVLDM